MTRILITIMGITTACSGSLQPLLAQCTRHDSHHTHEHSHGGHVHTHHHGHHHDVPLHDHDSPDHPADHHHDCHDHNQLGCITLLIFTKKDRTSGSNFCAVQTGQSFVTPRTDATHTSSYFAELTDPEPVLAQLRTIILMT